ncbi:hypothetical protein KAR91_02415 [Candidatus Pacearchaeota archaeon]|nr:hypothetical protein [Candidatus Pacearchaeota archaeon]
MANLNACFDCNEPVGYDCSKWPNLENGYVKSRLSEEEIEREKEIEYLENRNY